jgi:hypothetical protein
MASALDRRIGALEASAGLGEAHTILVRFVASGGVLTPLERVRSSGGVWHRLPGEDPQAFVDRVSTLTPVAPNCARVLVEDGASNVRT